MLYDYYEGYEDDLFEGKASQFNPEKLNYFDEFVNEEHFYTAGEWHGR